MDPGRLLMFLVIGALAGWIAGLLMRGRGFGVAGNIVVGIVGAVLGGLIFNLLGFAATGILGLLLTSTVGAVVLLFLVGQLKKA